MPSRILLVLSAATEVPLADGTRQPAGYAAAEAAAFCAVLGGAGHDVRVATPGGIPPTPEPGAEPVPATDAMPGLREPSALSQNEEAGDYAAVVIAGGRAALADLPGDPILGRLLLQARDAAVPIAAVGHGVAGLLSADRSIERPWPFKGVRMAASSDAEQRDLAGPLAWSLETALREAGAVVELGQPFACQVVVDGLLVTGQNEASAEPAARTLLGLMAART